MASAQKQAKRAKRAKTKAKQARIIRNNSSWDDAEESIGLSQQTIDLLLRMKESEAVSRFEMLKTLLSDSGLSNLNSIDETVDRQIILLEVYGAKVGEKRPSDWMKDASFLEEYANAARFVGREEFIGAWNDAQEF